MTAPATPTTAREWREHAEDLHNRGLVQLERLRTGGEMTAGVALAIAMTGHAFFAAAQAAYAAATYRAGGHKLTE